jgi:hypothetical protein
MFMSRVVGRRLEWRGDRKAEQSILAVDESNAITRVWTADPVLLKDLLNDMNGFEASGSTGSAGGSPQDFGPLILARSVAGDVLSIDPQRYWEGVADWFRSRGDDPHLYGRRGIPVSR